MVFVHCIKEYMCFPVLKELVFSRPGLRFYHRWSHPVNGAELLLRVQHESIQEPLPADLSELHSCALLPHGSSTESTGQNSEHSYSSSPITCHLKVHCLCEAKHLCNCTNMVQTRARLCSITQPVSAPAIHGLIWLLSGSSRLHFMSKYCDWLSTR